MSTAAPAVFSHITKDLGVRGGKACIDHTRVAVVDIVYMLKAGHTPEQMLTEYPLNLAQVHAALSYYYDHPEEIEASMSEDDRAEEEFERERAEYLRRHQSG